MSRLLFRGRSLLLAALIFIIVLTLNIYLLQSFFGYGLVNEDWVYILPYKYNDIGFIERIRDIWVAMGPRGGYYSIYLGIIDSIFPKDYEMLQKINFFWKVLATVSLFPTVWILTKDKIIAYLSTFFFAISHSAAGFLTYASTGVEYLGILLINIVAIAYYYLVQTKRVRYFLLAYLLLYGALLTAFLRVFPTIFILIAVEIYLVWTKRTSLVSALVRAAVIFIPAVLMVYSSAPGVMSRPQIDTATILPLLSGNLFLLLTPFAGIGLQIAPTWNNFIYQAWNGTLFSLWFILSIFLINYFVADLVAKNRRQFIIKLCVIEVVLFLILRFLNTAHLAFPAEQIIPHDQSIREKAFTSAIVGAIVFSISLISGWEWWKKQRINKTLFLIFISPIIALVYIGFTWIMMAREVGYYEGIHRYLPVSAMGVSIFLAAVVKAWVENRRASTGRVLARAMFIALIIIYMFATSQKGLNWYFTYYRSLGADLADQKSSEDYFFNKYIKGKNYFAAYFEPHPLTDQDIYLQRALGPETLSSWAFLRWYYSPDNQENRRWCFASVFGDYESLKKATSIKGGEFEFNLFARCGRELMRNPRYPIDDKQKWNFNQVDFFAFTVQNGQIVDLTSNVIIRLKTDLGQ